MNNSEIDYHQLYLNEKLLRELTEHRVEFLINRLRSEEDHRKEIESRFKFFRDGISRIQQKIDELSESLDLLIANED